MKFFNTIKKFFKNKNPTSTRVELLRDVGNGVYSWNGQLFKSEPIRACARPLVTAAGKLAGKQIRENKDGILENPDLYVKMLLEEPNPLMGGQVFQEKMGWHWYVNNNAFAYINRDANGYANEIYPIDAYSVEAVYDKSMTLFLKFSLVNGKQVTFPYSDVAHLRRDFCDNDIFGAGNTEILQPLMDVVVATDQSIIAAIKNSGVIKWLLKFTRNLTPEDLQKRATAFSKSYLDSTVEGSSIGVAATDTNAEVEQVEPKDYVPNALIMDRIMKRLYSYFNTNEKIVMSSYNEDEWNSFYESVVEPFSQQLSQELTRKIFSRRERGFGNKIVYDASSLQYASMKTKLGLVQMVDRGAMTPNEWRRVMNLSGIEGGDKAIRRLDTAVVGTKGGENK